MIFHMRTTLIIDDTLFRALKKRAAEERRTLTDVTQEVIRLGLERRAGVPRRRRRVRLASFAMGRPRVDLADREGLYELLDGR
jgi:hypothetical protein